MPSSQTSTWLAAGAHLLTTRSGASLPQQSLDLTTYPTTPLQQFGFFVIFFFPALSLIVVSLRIYGRVSTKTLGWDDTFIIAAVLCAAMQAAPTYAMMKLEYIGVHVRQIPTTPYDPKIGLIFNFIVVVLYNPELGLVKSSVLFFLLRLGGHDTAVRRSIYLLNTVNLMLLVSVFMASIFTCVPISKYWNPSMDGHCNRQDLQYIITSSITVITDVLVMIIPVKLVVGLQMTKRTKISLITVLCIGILSIVFSILRLLTISNMYYGTFTEDPTYSINFVYSTMECNLAIISASVPTLYGMLKRRLPWLFAKTENTGSGPVFPGEDRATESYALRTIGGSTLRFITSPSTRHNRTQHNRLNSLTASKEEMFESHGIRKTTKVEVMFDDKPWADKGEGDNVAEAASRFRFDESVRTYAGSQQAGGTQTLNV